MSSSVVKSIIYEIKEKKPKVHILNQLLLPSKIVYEDINGVEDAWNAIRNMKVRGAPAIAIVGLLGLVIELSKPEIVESFHLDECFDNLFEYIEKKINYLCTSRPTAVNIRKELNKLLEYLNERAECYDFTKVFDWLKEYCYKLIEYDKKINRKISEIGSEHLIRFCPKSRSKFIILTHCNTGNLATAGYGTALGVIRMLHEKQLLSRVFCTETRPYNQGSRLTAWELFMERIPSTLICDNMIASLMNSVRIDAVIVGADRILARLDGCTINKIGTYQIAVLAKHFKVPFFVAAPISTIDFTTKDLSEIIIEERPHREMKWIGDVQIAPNETNCWNPAFDITPGKEYITGIITENRVIEPDKVQLMV